MAIKAKKLLAGVLSAFVLLSVGVALGRELAARPDESLMPIDGTMVYYLHGMPCDDCTFVDTTAREMIESEFAEDIAAGRLRYVSVNYFEHEELARKFEVGHNTIIAVRYSEQHRERLEDVMSLVEEPDKLRDYVRQGVRRTVAAGQQAEASAEGGE